MTEEHGEHKSGPSSGGIILDESRLAELARTGLLDSAAEKAFDRLTGLASRILGVPVALVSLVDQRRQFFKSHIGLPAPWDTQRETPLSHSFCQHVVNTAAPLVVSDAREHPLVRDNLAISDLGVIAYAGVPLTTNRGHTLGAFCAIDSRPREWTSEEIEILTDLTAFAVSEIELKLTLREARQAAESADHERKEKSALLDSTAEGVFGIDVQGRCTFINRAAAEMLGYDPPQVLGRNFHQFAHHSRSDGAPYPEDDCPISNACRAGQIIRGSDEVFWRSDGSNFAVAYSASPIFEGEHLKGSVVTISDITQQKRASRRLAIQHAVSDALAKAFTFREAAPNLLQSLGEALEWQLGAVWEVDEQIDVLRCVATWSAPGVEALKFETATKQLSFARGEGLPGKVWLSGEPVYSNDILQEGYFLRATVAAEEGLHGAALFPVRAGTDVLGVIEFFSRWTPTVDTDLFRAIKTVGYQIGQFIRRERTQEALRKSEALKATVIHTAMDCVILMDHRGTVLEWNPAAEKTFGYSRDEVLGREMAELIVPPSLREAHRHGLQRFLQTGEGVVIGKRFEITAVRRDSAEFPVELAITAVSLGGVPAFAGYVRDITERKLEESRQQEQMRLAALTADIGIAITQRENLEEMLQQCCQALVQHLDAAFARIWTADSQEQMLELKASAGIYTHVDGNHRCIPVGQYKIGLIAQQRTPHLTNSVASDSRISDPDWARREGMVAFAGYPLLVGDELVGVMGMFARKTLSQNTLQAMATIANGIALGIQRLRTQEELKNSKRIADEANRAKSQFLANMSHELRTPLNAVILYSELLMEEAQDMGLEGFLPDLEKIRNAGKHLLGLINNVLDLSKIEAGKMELYLETFELHSAVEQVTTTVRPLVEKRSNRLDVQCVGDLGVMRSDLTKVRQILFNLLSNASKFTENGSITLSVKREVVDDHSWIIFEVRDTGIGMTEEQRANLFQPFMQADVSTTRKYGGTGLGLAISKWLCEMLSGNIDVASQLGEGSTFTIRLPAETPTDPSDSLLERDPISQAEAAAAGTVLVIDDDRGIRETMTRLLRKEGFLPITARNGEEGLQLVRDHRPDIIMLDVMMPRMDGWTVLTALKADPDLADIPVVMLTIVENQNLGYMLGASEFLLKPIDRSRLSAVLERYQPRRTCRRVLIAEDDEGTRRMLVNALAEEGCEAVEAKNGREALERIIECQPDLILLDLLMPEVDGFQLARELRQHDAWNKIPIVIITAKDLDQMDRRRLEGNVQKILQKTTGEELLRDIRELTRRCIRTATNNNDITAVAQHANTPASGQPVQDPQDVSRNVHHQR